MEFAKIFSCQPLECYGAWRVGGAVEFFVSKGRVGAVVMLRITLESHTLEEVILAVAGWLAGDDVELMEQEIGRWYQEDRRLVLDLEGVKFIDESGLALLKRWSGKQLVLRGGSGFVRMLLKSDGLA